MPVFEMPLSEMKSYRGINPKPDDFDAYWHRAMDDLAGTASDITLEKADFQTSFAECFHLYFTGVHGARIHAKYLRPKRRLSSRPALLQFHGYTGNCGEFHEKLGYVAAGFSVAAMDARGQGGLSEDPGGVKGCTQHGHIIRGLDDHPDHMYYRQVFLDTVQLARIMIDMPEVDETRICAMGMSQGGALTLACASLEPRIRRLVPQCPFLCDYQRVWEMDLAQNAYAELKDYFRRFDPRHEREQEIFTRLGYIDCQHLAERICGDVLMSTGLMDDICPPSTQFAAYNKITATKQQVLYPDFAHEGYPGFMDEAFLFLQAIND